MDDFDMASVQEAQALQRALDVQALRAAAAPRLHPVGHCHNPRCLDDFPAGDQRLFCGAECADTHKRLSNLKN